MKTVLVLLQPSAGIAIFRLYCGHPKHQIYVDIIDTYIIDTHIYKCRMVDIDNR